MGSILTPIALVIVILAMVVGCVWVAQDFLFRRLIEAYRTNGREKKYSKFEEKTNQKDSFMLNDDASRAPGPSDPVPAEIPNAPKTEGGGSPPAISNLVPVALADAASSSTVAIVTDTATPLSETNDPAPSPPPCLVKKVGLEIKSRPAPISNEELDAKLANFKQAIQDYINEKPQLEISPKKTILTLDNIDTPLWVIGDIHGDLKSLKLITNFVYERSNGAVPTLLFLGDLIDDGENSAEVAAWVMYCSNGHAFQGRKFTVYCIAGNHDIALKYNENDQSFNSEVSPCNFKDELNAEPPDSATRHLGKSLCDYFSTLPRMALINGTVMAVHGAVPHKDVLGDLKTKDDLSTNVNACNDITWGRLHERMPEKYPNRNTRGHELGFKNFRQFLDKMASAEFFGKRPRITFRGHDHFDGNFREYEKYSPDFVLTVTALSQNHRAGTAAPLSLVVAKWDPKNPDTVTLYKLESQPTVGAVDESRKEPA